VGELQVAVHDTRLVRGFEIFDARVGEPVQQHAHQSGRAGDLS